MRWEEVERPKRREEWRGWMDGWRCESNAFLEEEEDEKEGQNRKGSRQAAEL